MSINIKSLYKFFFAFIILVQLYIPSYRFIIFSQIIILFIILLIEKRLNSHLIKVSAPLLLLVLLPVVPVFFNEYKLTYVLKDIFLIIKPLLGLFIGYLIFQRINNFKEFIKIVIIIGFFSAIIHFIIVVLNGGLNTGSLSQIREYGKDNFLELFSFFFVAYYSKFYKEKLFYNRKTQNIIFLILLFSCLLYLSRTMLILSIILILAIYGYLKITKRTVKIFLILISCFTFLFIYLSNIKIDRNETGLMGFFYKIKMAPAEIFDSKFDRENHVELWNHWRAYEAKCAFNLMINNPSSFIIGNGYGSLINLKFNAPLGSNDKGMKYISEIHNGYVFIFYKFGIFGIILTFMFLFNLYLKTYKKVTFQNVFLSSIAVCYFFTTLTITGIFNKRDIIIYLLGALLYYSSKTYLKLLNETKD